LSLDPSSLAGQSRLTTVRGGTAGLNRKGEGVPRGVGQGKASPQRQLQGPQAFQRRNQILYYTIGKLLKHRRETHTHTSHHTGHSWDYRSVQLSPT